MSRRTDGVGSRCWRRCTGSLIAVAMSAWSAPVQAGETGHSPVAILSTVTVGAWQVIAVRDAGTEACVARRVLAGSGVDQPRSIAFFRTCHLGWARER